MIRGHERAGAARAAVDIRNVDARLDFVAAPLEHDDETQLRSSGVYEHAPFEPPFDAPLELRCPQTRLDALPVLDGKSNEQRRLSQHRRQGRPKGHAQRSIKSKSGPHLLISMLDLQNS